MNPRAARFAALAILASLCAAAGPAETPAPQSKPTWTVRHQQKLQEIKSAAPAMIFIGDSITQELENDKPKFGDINGVWRRFYACRRAVNLGFAGDTTGNALWRLQNGEIDGIAPKLAVVLIGTNDVGPRAGADPADAAAGVQSVAALVHQRLPATRILVLGLLPRGRADEQRQQVNANLARVDWPRLNTVFVNVDQALLKNGAPDPALYRETPAGRPALHPNAAGWTSIARAIEPQVAQVLPPCGGG